LQKLALLASTFSSSVSGKLRFNLREGDIRGRGGELHEGAPFMLGQGEFGSFLASLTPQANADTVATLAGVSRLACILRHSVVLTDGQVQPVLCVFRLSVKNFYLAVMEIISAAGRTT
jgi:hypothetical protein